MAGSDGDSFFVLVCDAALATLWIAGIQAVIWGLIPIKRLYGQKVLAPALTPPGSQVGGRVVSRAPAWRPYPR